MKKLLSVFCFILAFSLLLSPLCHAESENTDTLVSWDIRITVPGGAEASLKGDEYYIYAGKPGSIPYVMLRPYRYDSVETFLADFTDFMRGQYDDLKVTKEASPKSVGSKAGMEIDYSYTISGYTATDRRIAVKHGDRVYMFASKEIEELGMTVGSMLEDVVANAVFLSADESSADSDFSPCYLYCQEDGLPKYWLDLSGTLAPNAVLHCMFISSDPTYYESWFILDLDTATEDEEGIHIHKVLDSHDFDHSNKFTRLCLKRDGDALIMEVERDEKTLAGGAGDNILTGEYRMEPIGDGPFTPKELGKLSQLYYLRKTGFYPPLAELEKNDDGSFSVHLFEVVTLDGLAHTATSAWYSVDTNGEGVNDITGEAVSLIPHKTVK